jgi:hydrogenase nickel incorporation protein HypA/HybF
MHELSIAVSIVEAVGEELANHPEAKVTKVMIRIGALSGVVPEALEFAWPSAVDGTRLEGSKLAMETVDVVAWCPSCENETPVAERNLLRCPVCGEATPEIRRGKELEIRAVEVRDSQPDEG